MVDDAKPQTWYTYECLECSCVFDVRLDGFPLEQSPMMHCPQCLTHQASRGHWQANELGGKRPADLARKLRAAIRRSDTAVRDWKLEGVSPYPRAYGQLVGDMLALLPAEQMVPCPDCKGQTDFFVAHCAYCEGVGRVLESEVD